MNVNDYTYLINNPNAITEKQTLALENILEEFPFFQSARALQLKGLYDKNSFRYNLALKVTAAHTTDRSVLFDFITSDTFITMNNESYQAENPESEDINIDKQETLKSETKSGSIMVDSIEELIIENPIKEPIPIQEVVEKTKSLKEKLAIGKPLEFSIKEQHSFQEWLQLSRNEPIKRKKEVLKTPKNEPIDEEKKKKAELIDKFIETSPKISPVKHGSVSSFQFDINTDDNSYLMTETLAKVYLEQKKYQKAIQAYEILILKYPEKSSFFADRISDIKILQQNN